MRAILPLRLCISATFLYALATLAGWGAEAAAVATEPVATHAAPVRTAGPWVTLAEDGSCEVAVAVQALSDEQVATMISLATAAGVRLAAPTLRKPDVPHDALSGDRVAAFHLVGEAARGSLVLSIGQMSYPVTIPATPAAGAAVRVALITARTYPDAAGLEALGTALGGPVQVVVATGPGLGDRLGTGGWEAGVPLLVVSTQRPIPAGVISAEPRRERLGPAAHGWPHGTAWGALGLPAIAALDQAGVNAARDPRRWPVLLAVQADWDLGLRARRGAGDLAAAVPLIALCQRLDVPLVLGTGSGSGWISEPLHVEHNHLQVVAGGCRFIAATPAGDGLASLPDEVAAACDVAALVGLAADADTLTAVLVAAEGGAVVQRLDWRRDDDLRLGTGWGAGDAAKLTPAWLAGGKEAPAALADLAWLPLAQLATIKLGDADRIALAQAAPKDAASMRLLRRLVAVDALVTSDLQNQLAELPAPVARDLALRQIARPRLIDESRWAAFIARDMDASGLAALLRAYEQLADADQAQRVLVLLLGRVRAQAEGRVPPEADVMLEHRLLSAICDAGTLSPTLVRPLAVALRDRLTGLPRQPVERFISRYGEIRPP